MKPEKSSPVKTQSQVDLSALESMVGDFMQYWGFKKIHGRIWTHLFTSEIPLDTAELMSRLGVSKGLMSLAIRDLLQYEVIRPVDTGYHGSVFYEANPDLQGVITNVLRQREAKMLEKTRGEIERLIALKDKTLTAAGVSPERLQDVLELTNSAEGLLSVFLTLNCSTDPRIFLPLVETN